VKESASPPCAAPNSISAFAALKMGSKASGTGPYLLLGNTDRPEKGKMLKLINSEI
jgi:hypothetical protein